MFPDAPNIPPEIEVKILSHLTHQKLAKAALVSRAWYNGVGQNIVWQELIKDSFTKELINEAKNIYERVLEQLNKDELTGAEAKHLYRICKLLQKYYALSHLLPAPNVISSTLHILGVKEDDIGDLINTLIISDVKILSSKPALAREAIFWNFYNNNIGNDGVKTIADALMNLNCKVNYLDLGHNQTGIAGAQTITKALKNPNCEVTHLYLECNEIGDAGAQSIAEALKHPNCKVFHLHLGANKISAAGAQSIAEALKHPNCKVTHLYLTYNQINIDGAKAIAEALKNPNCKVTHLYLECNYISDAGTQAIAEALTDLNCKVTHLALSSNKIGAAGAKAITEALKHLNCKVTYLDLEHNRISDTGKQALAAAVVSVENTQNRRIEIKL